MVRPDGKQGEVNKRYGYLEPFLAENIEAPGTSCPVLTWMHGRSSVLHEDFGAQ